MESGRYGHGVKEEKNDGEQELSLDLLRDLFSHLNSDAVGQIFLGSYKQLDEKGNLKQGPNEKPKLKPTLIVAFYMAYINNESYRKIFAPHFLSALETCTLEEITTLVQSTRPVESEVYRAIEKVGLAAKHTKYIEAYICYAFVTNDINKLSIEELNGVIHYLNENHSGKKKIIATLTGIKQALLVSQQDESLRDRTLITGRYNGRFNFDALIPPKLNFNWAFVNSIFLNFSSAKISDFVFTSIPTILNLENTTLSNCQFHCSDLSFINLRNSKLKNISISGSSNNNRRAISVNLCGANIIDIIKLDGNCRAMIDSDTLYSRAIIQMLGIPQVMNTYLPGMNRNIGARLFTIAHVIANYGWDTAQALVYTSALQMDKIAAQSTFYFELPREIQTPEDLTKELNKYNEVEKKLDTFSHDTVEYKAFSEIRKMLVTAVLEKLAKLSANGTDIQPFYEAALNHPCFAHRDTIKRLFNVAYTTSQKELIQGYKELIADFAPEEVAKSSHEKSPKK